MNATQEKRVQTILAWVHGLALALVCCTSVLLYGFDEAILSPPLLHGVQVVLLVYWVSEKCYRATVSEERADHWRENRVELTLMGVLLGVLLLQVLLLDQQHWDTIWHTLGCALVLQLIVASCRVTVRFVSLGKNPTGILITSFVVLILVGTGLLSLPKASTGAPLSLVDALFTATSATCVTGLVVKETGSDFTIVGQVVILGLIQLGGLGIVVFGAVFSLLLGQAFTLRESVAMQDVLSAGTLRKIGKMIGFIFAATLVIEAIGMLGLVGMWNDVPAWQGGPGRAWFYSLFHAVSAFCNAGFGLCSDSLVEYRQSWAVYGVICPLILFGGLGFRVLYNVGSVLRDRVLSALRRTRKDHRDALPGLPLRWSLEAKIVLTASLCLLVLGTLFFWIFEHYGLGSGKGAPMTVLDAFFQSVTARTAGFNTVDIDALTPSSRLVFIVLMLIGGAPGSTAGGMKTVTLVVLVMAAITSLRKRSDVEIFHRAVRASVISRAVTVIFLFGLVYGVAVLSLSITEAGQRDTTLSDICFEVASALGTVGLTTGVTPILTVTGKLIIMIVMLIGRLGPLTLLAALTFDLKPVRYNYPQESLMVG